MPKLSLMTTPMLERVFQVRRRPIYIYFIKAVGGRNPASWGSPWETEVPQCRAYMVFNIALHQKPHLIGREPTTLMNKLVSIVPDGPSNSKEKLKDLECCVGENEDRRVKERDLNTMGAQWIFKPEIPDQG